MEMQSENRVRKLKKRDYERELERMQVELNDLAHWLKHTKKRMIVLFESRDTADKGDVINAIAERLNPRQIRIVALAKATEREQTQWYFQRYVAHLPGAGELVLFDRSWYNRAGVEKVMGYCANAEYDRFLKEAPVFENMLVDDGILLYKYWLAVDQRYQEKRFAERAADPLKRWKLSAVDLEARERYVEYGRVRDAMFKVTHTERNRWHVVNFNDQRRGRLNLIRHWLDSVPVRRVPEEPLDLATLENPPAKERFDGPVKPIGDRFGGGR
jgi:polyphosphate kinase 2